MGWGKGKGSMLIHSQIAIDINDLDSVCYNITNTDKSEKDEGEKKNKTKKS
jgi:hypothetical protein